MQEWGDFGTKLGSSPLDLVFRSFFFSKYRKWMEERRDFENLARKLRMFTDSESARVLTC